MVFVAAVLMLGTFLAALAGVAAVRRRPVLLSAPLALAAVVVLEAVLLDVLSLAHAVAAPALVAAHLAVLLAAAALAGWRGARPADLVAAARRGVASVRALGWPVLLLVPVALLATLSAVRYAPNNWDSMTYHLARIAHWLQHRSVAPFPTPIERQVIYQPGAEYVLAAVQGMGGSDGLDNLLQFAAWLVAVLASPALARLAGAPRRLAPWAAVVVGALPMGVLQASSTQNDLVAAALTLAVIVAASPFLHRAPRWRIGDAALLGLAVGAGALVKATVLVAAAPFVVIALWRAVRATPRRPAAVALAVAVTAAVAAVPVAPETIRRLDPDLSVRLARHAAAYTYAGTLDVGDRLQNLLRGVARNAPAPRALVAAAGIPPASWCGPADALCSGHLFRPHEDNAGNPTHVAIVLLAAGVALARWRRLPARSALFLVAVPAAWVLFHFTFRDNAWIARLETPTYVLTGLAVVAWASRPSAAAAPAGGKRKRAASAAAPSPVPFAATAIVAALALVFSTKVAADNEPRPPLGGASGPLQHGYYANQPTTGRAHDIALSAARQLRCTRLGLNLGEDSFDYPLTWRAMQQGIEVRHVFGEDPWPCLVFTDQRPKTDVVARNRWSPTNVPFLFVNGADPARGPASSPAAARAP
jgi:hypothetical protein